MKLIVMNLLLFSPMILDSKMDKDIVYRDVGIISTGQGFIVDIKPIGTTGLLGSVRGFGLFVNGIGVMVRELTSYSTRLFRKEGKYYHMLNSNVPINYWQWSRFRIRWGPYMCFYINGKHVYHTIMPGRKHKVEVGVQKFRVHIDNSPFNQGRNR